MTASLPAPKSVTRDFLRLLDVEGTAQPTRFRAHSDPHPGGHVFGGQVMAQALVAMGRTVPKGRRIHSTFGYFLEAATADEPLTFTIETLRDGGSFSARRALATQGKRTVFAMSASFQEQQSGFVHQDATFPGDVPSPESLPTTADLLGQVDHPAAQYLAHRRPIDIRHVTAPLYYQADTSGTSKQMVWMRSLTPIAPEVEEHNPHIHDAILAFATDYTPFESMLRRQGLTWLSPGLKMATLNHALWWHSHASMNEWLLYVQQSPSASGGRGLTTGHLFRESGELVATLTQEGMFRGPTDARRSPAQNMEPRS